MSEKLPGFQAPTPSSPGKSWVALIVVPLVLFGIILAFAPNFTPTDQVRRDPLGGDFLQEYAGGKLFRDSRQNSELYNVDVCRQIQHDSELLGFTWQESRFFPMVYPPFYYAAVSPFSQLEYLTAARCWLLLMTLFLIGGLLILNHNLQVPTWLLILTCLTGPLLLSLTTGQKSSLLFLILSATWALFRSHRPFASGAIFGLIAFKPHLGIPIGLFMLVRRQWSFVMGCYFTVGCLIVASFMTGFDICTDYFGVTMGFTDYVHNDGYQLEHGFSLWSFWQLACQDSGLAWNATIISSLLVLCGTVFFLRKPGCYQGDQLSRSFSAMTIATLLVSPHLYPYDLTILLLPAVLLADLAIKSGSRRWVDLAPLIALAIVLFGMHPLIVLGQASGLNLGVPLLMAAWVLILRSTQDQSESITSTTELAATV